MTTDEESLVPSNLIFSVNDDEWDGEYPKCIDVVLVEDVKVLLKEERQRIKAEWDKLKLCLEDQSSDFDDFCDCYTELGTHKKDCMTINIRKDIAKFEKVFEDGK
jgi:hypothetical protein